MERKTGFLHHITKSGFVRSVITRVLIIFITISIIITAVAFWSFTTEIRRSVLDDMRKQLAAVEDTISGRMDEITSIAYHIGQDPIIYFDAVENDLQTDREMSEMLQRYLVGNSFIEHLAYSRTSEPDTIYTAAGKRSLSQFFINSFGMDPDVAAATISFIHSENQTNIRVYGNGKGGYFAYLYPLPQLSTHPKAHVLMMIPVKAVQSLFETLFHSSRGGVSVFAADGSLIYSAGDLNDDIDLSAFVKNGEMEENYESPSGQKYVLQKTVSKSNSWTYVSVIRHGDTLSGPANKQLIFILLIWVLLVVAIVLMLASIITQYKPISNLAAQMAGTVDGSDDHRVIDERKLLSDTVATLKDDSEQKQKYETAFYEAEAASKAKSAFLSSMSHDIRTPLNAIIGMTAIARSHIGDQSYVDDCLQKVQMSSDYLLSIINNVLDMSRIESGRIPITEEPVMISALIDNVVSLMTSSAKAKNQTIDVEIEKLKNPAVIGDNIHIVQVFMNIVSNAVKFTPNGGRIKILVHQTTSEDAQAGDYVFAFTDTGVGIPPDFIGHVFDTFSRANESGASRTEGTGLGMAIAKKLVELMGGTITCESELGRGTTFTVRMHMRYADEKDTPMLLRESLNGQSGKSNANQAVPDLTGRRIMLAEDNSMNRLIANRIIAETGAEVIEACDGQQAVEAFKSHPVNYFDIILMDIQMPNMNGYEATKAIRTMDRADGKTVLILAMTANTFDEDVRQVKDAGMNGHIGKPYTPQILYDTLSRAIGANRREQV